MANLPNSESASRLDRRGAALPPPPLYRDRDYGLLWAGQTINHVGDAVSTIALPLLAITALHINALESGFLRAAGQVTALLSLPLGILADRLRRRRLMVGTDLLRTAVTVSIPVAALTGFLTFPMLLLVALVMGLLDSLFAIACTTHLPDFLDDQHRVEGTAHLGSGRFGALTGGYALGGLLVAVTGAARALLLDSVSFVVSALTLLAIRRPDPVHRPRPHEAVSVGPPKGFVAVVRGWREEIRAGVRQLRGEPQLGVLAVTGAGVSFALSLSIAVEMLFLVQDLQATALEVGLVYGLPVLAGVVGSRLSIRLMRSPGPERVMRGAILGYAPLLAIPALAPAGPAGLVIAGAAWAALILVASAYNASSSVLRQQITPAATRGRINATIRTMAAAAKLLALLLGGVVGALVGLRAAMLVAAVTMSLPTVLLLTSDSFRRPLPNPAPGG